MSDHAVTWDHRTCEHEDDDCSPSGSLTCLAAPDAYCRLYEPDGPCESWSVCDYPLSEHTMGPHFQHHDVGPVHCDQGHRLVPSGYCNAQLFIDYQGMADSHINGWPGEFVDGPVDLEWTGEGYLWTYSAVST